MFAWLKRLFARLFGSQPQPKALPPGRTATLTSLQIGDIVAHLDATYIVSQKIVNHAHGFFWYDYRLDGGDEEHLWLSVEDDDELIVALYRPIDYPLNGEPPDQIEHAGQVYRLEEKGSSDAKISRESGSETRTTVHSWDYAGPNGTFLGIQRWGDEEYEVMIGQSVSPATLDLMAQPD